MLFIYVNCIKTSSYVEPFFNIDLEAVFLVSAKRRCTHTLNVVVSSVSKKMYPLKLPLWYSPWDGAIFSKRVIEVVVICWYRIAWGLKFSARRILTICTLQKGVWWPKTHHVSHFRKMKEGKMRKYSSLTVLSLRWWNRS